VQEVYGNQVSDNYYGFSISRFVCEALLADENDGDWHNFSILFGFIFEKSHYLNSPSADL
jgi:hypothetical protein